MFATLAAKGANRRDALNAQLQAMEELPEIDGRSYVVKHLTVTEQSDQPMVCTPQAESLKAEAAALLAELVQLQQEALALVKGSLELAKANCDGATMLAIENALGVPSAGPDHRLEQYVGDDVGRAAARVARTACAAEGHTQSHTRQGTGPRVCVWTVRD